MQVMHASFNNELDLLKKMYENQQMDYDRFKSEIESNLKTFSQRIDSRLFNPPNIT